MGVRPLLLLCAPLQYHTGCLDHATFIKSLLQIACRLSLDGSHRDVRPSKPALARLGRAIGSHSETTAHRQDPRLRSSAALAMHHRRRFSKVGEEHTRALALTRDTYCSHTRMARQSLSCRACSASVLLCASRCSEDHRSSSGGPCKSCRVCTHNAEYCKPRESCQVTRMRANWFC